MLVTHVVGRRRAVVVVDVDLPVTWFALSPRLRERPRALQGAQHARAVVARLEDLHWGVREVALDTLAKLEPARLAQHTGAVVARLEDFHSEVRMVALETLAKLEPMTLAQLAGVVFAGLEDPKSNHVRQAACHTLEMLPRYVRDATRFRELLSSALNHGAFEQLRSRLLGRVAWYRCRIRLRVRSLLLYWYALPYSPSGPGHARDVEAWNHMIEE